jgi:hypothetical protein
MPIEIHEVEIINEPAATAASAAAAPRPASATPNPTEQGEQLRAWYRELACRASRLRAD